MGLHFGLTAVQGVILYFRTGKIQLFSEKMANHLLMVGLILLAGTTLTLGKKDDEDCPFGPGSCPVTLDNVVDVYFHDIDDKRSCQRECRQIEECKFFTMKPDPDSPHDHMKCFLFKTCDPMEACDDCITDLICPYTILMIALTMMEIILVKLHWTMWLMYIFLMSKMHPSPITNAFCSKNAISMNLVRHVKQDQKTKGKILENCGKNLLI